MTERTNLKQTLIGLANQAVRTLGAVFMDTEDNPPVFVVERTAEPQIIFQSPNPEVAKLETGHLSFSLETLPGNGEELILAEEALPFNLTLSRGMQVDGLGSLGDQVVVSLKEKLKRGGGKSQDFRAIIPEKVLTDLRAVKQSLPVLDQQTFDKYILEAGAMWCHRKEDGTLYENPVVPYPPYKLTQGNYGGIAVNEDGEYVALSADLTSEIAVLRNEREQWLWEAITTRR